MSRNGHQEQEAPPARRIVPTDDTGDDLDISAHRSLAVINNEPDAMAPVQAGTTIQKVQTRYTAAVKVQVPRELPAVEARSMQEADLLGPRAFYAWGAGEDRIEGSTVKLAMALVRCYGNCAVDLDEVQDFPDSWVFTARFVDLETGFTLSRQFRQSKRSRVFGKHDEERKMDIRFQIGQSKAVRNVVLNAVPAWLSERCIDRAKGGVKKNIQALIDTHGMEKIQKAAMSQLAKMGAAEARVLAFMGRKNVPSLTIEDLVVLSGVKAALESGQDTIDSVFPPVEAEAADPSKSKNDQMKERLKATPPPAGDDTGSPPSGGGSPTPAASSGPADGDTFAEEAAALMEAEKAKKGQQGTLLPDDKPAPTTVSRKPPRK